MRIPNRLGIWQPYLAAAGIAVAGWFAAGHLVAEAEGQSLPEILTPAPYRAEIDRDRSDEQGLGSDFPQPLRVVNPYRAKAVDQKAGNSGQLGAGPHRVDDHSRLPRPIIILGSPATAGPSDEEAPDGQMAIATDDPRQLAREKQERLPLAPVAQAIPFRRPSGRVEEPSGPKTPVRHGQPAARTRGKVKNESGGPDTPVGHGSAVTTTSTIQSGHAELDRLWRLFGTPDARQPGRPDTPVGYGQPAAAAPSTLESSGQRPVSGPDTPVGDPQPAQDLLHPFRGHSTRPQTGEGNPLRGLATSAPAPGEARHQPAAAAQRTLDRSGTIARRPGPANTVAKPTPLPKLGPDPDQPASTRYGTLGTVPGGGSGNRPARARRQPSAPPALTGAAPAPLPAPLPRRLPEVDKPTVRSVTDRPARKPVPYPGAIAHQGGGSVGTDTESPFRTTAQRLDDLVTTEESELYSEIAPDAIGAKRAPAWVEGPPGFGYSSGYGARCQPFCYGRTEAIYWQRDQADQVTVTPLLTFDDFDFEWGGRVTIGRQFDCLEGLELSYAHLDQWSESREAFDPGGTLQSNFVAPGGQTSRFEDFNDAVGHRIEYESQLHNFEVNRRQWGWGVISAMWGFRYIHLKENFSFTSVDSNGDVGLYETETQNHLPAVQLGGDLVYPIGRRCSIDGKTKLGGFLSFTEQVNHFNNSNLPAILNGTRDVGVGFLTETGVNANYRILPRVTARIGYEFAFLWGVALAPNQIDFVVGPNMGRAIDDEGSIFMHGPTAGVEATW